jgi:hypothetical protein
VESGTNRNAGTTGGVRSRSGEKNQFVFFSATPFSIETLPKL